MYAPGGNLTLDSASPAFEAGLKAIAAGQAEFDFAALATFDSSAVAAMLAWRRAAQARGLTLRYVNVSPSLQNLVDLYDVTDLLQQA